MKKRVCKKDIRAADAEYANALSCWGERNQITIRADIRRYELKKLYELQKAEREVKA